MSNNTYAIKFNLFNMQNFMRKLIESLGVSANLKATCGIHMKQFSEPAHSKAQE